MVSAVLELAHLELDAANAELHTQNDELAARIASSRVQETTPKDSLEASEMLSWEERKKLILLQMEEGRNKSEVMAAAISRQMKEMVCTAQREEGKSAHPHTYTCIAWQYMHTLCHTYMSRRQGIYVM